MGAGCVFLGGGDEAGISWQGPWLLLSVATGLSLCLTPFVSILTGCNQVEQINRFRVQQSFLNTLTMWGCMWMGANLWTLPVATLVGVACTLYLVAVRYGEFFQGLRLVHCQQVIAWTTEILPLQWRVAVSSLCAVLATQVFTPVLFHYRGATVAGQMGMTWMAFNALLDVAMTWVNVKLPQFGMYVARRDFEALDRAALRAARTALLVLSAGGSSHLWAGCCSFNGREAGWLDACSTRPPQRSWRSVCWAMRWSASWSCTCASTSESRTYGCPCWVP